MTQVSDLSPLEGQSLTTLAFTPKDIAKGIDVIRQMKSLKTIELDWDSDRFTPDEFWKKYDAGEFGKPGATQQADRHLHRPRLQKWIESVAAMPCREAGSTRSSGNYASLIQISPRGFFDRDWQDRPRVVDGAIPVVVLNSEGVTNLSPLRAVAGLKTLIFPGRAGRGSNLSDLSPLQGLDLEEIGFYHTKVDSLSPLAGMRLKSLVCGGSPIADLSPLIGMPLKVLDCSMSDVHDLTPLADMPLEDFCFDPQKITVGLEAIRRKKSITAIGILGHTTWPPAEFWRKYDVGDFGKPGSANTDSQAKPITTFNDPAFKKWAKDVAKLLAECR